MPTTRARSTAAAVAAVLIAILPFAFVIAPPAGAEEAATGSMSDTLKNAATDAAKKGGAAAVNSALGVPSAPAMPEVPAAPTADDAAGAAMGAAGETE